MEISPQFDKVIKVLFSRQKGCTDMERSWLLSKTLSWYHTLNERINLQQMSKPVYNAGSIQ